MHTAHFTHIRERADQWNKLKKERKVEMESRKGGERKKDMGSGVKEEE